MKRLTGKKKCVGILALALAGAVALTACGEQDRDSDRDEERQMVQQELDPEQEEALQEEIEQELEEYDAETIEKGYLDYSMELFRGSVKEGTNSMISPTSVMMALELAAAGAEGETQEQITGLFCEGVSQAQMEHYCKDLMERYESSEDVELHLANSIWINDMIAERMEEDYLVRSSYIFDAEASILPFDEEATDFINEWCDDNTDGMIPKLFNEIDPMAQLYLINATAIDAPWQDPYDEHQVKDETFTNASGDEEDVKMMHEVGCDYFETEDAVGFLKYYEGYEYAFLAILPEEGMTVDEYVAGLTGEKYQEFWDSWTGEYDVYTRLPEFTYDYELELNDVLQDMGMTQAFDDGADFSGIADADLYISRVLHKTFIEVGPVRTRAAAVTAVEVCATSAMVEPRETREVYLDRPFVYAIVEADTGMPIFIGTVQSVNN